MIRRPVLDLKGNPIVLNQLEAFRAQVLERKIKQEILPILPNGMVENALGADIDITTLTSVAKLITTQKFFEIMPADFMPVRAGNADTAWSDQILTYRSYSMGGDFEQGLINTGADQARLASADAGVDSVPVKVYLWAKELSWTIPDIAYASRSGNWDIVTAKEIARKKNWDLGIQKVAFLGSKNVTGMKGYMTQTGVTNNTTRITKNISSMTTAEFKTFCANVLNDYRTNCDRTAWPSIFSVPESDYLGLAAPTSADFPLKSTLQVLEETFSVMTKRPFKILPNAYGDAARNANYGSWGSSGKQVYVLSSYDEEASRIDIPMPYVNTLANSVNNFQFLNVGYGQFTGFQAYRPKEMLYFSF